MVDRLVPASGLLLLAACTAGGAPCGAGFTRGADGGCYPASDPADTADTGDAVQTTPGWSLGTPRPCADPVEPTWTDAATDVVTWAEPDERHLPPAEPGGMALVPRGDHFALFWAEPESPAQAVDLATGETFLSGLGTSAAGFAMDDLDGDGALDVVVLGFDPVIVWGAGTDDPEVEDFPWTQVGQNFLRDVAFGDYDEDGDVDGVTVYTGPFGGGEHLGELVRNGGDRTLLTETITGVAADTWGYAFDAYPMDYDVDGDLDVLVCNDTPDNLKSNLLLAGDGAGGFTAVFDNGIDISLDCMGFNQGDLDADDDLDVIIGDSLRVVTLEQVDGQWYDAGQARGLTFWMGTIMAFGVGVADLDNDGGMHLISPLSDFYTGGTVPEHPVMDYERGADGTYTDTGRLPPAAGGRTAIPFDLDGDGTLDVLMGDAFRSPWRLMGSGCTAGSWLEVEAPSASVVHVTAGGVTRAAPVTTDQSYASAGPPVAHVGLGEATTVDSVVLVLGDGTRAELAGPQKVNQRIVWRP